MHQRIALIGAGKWGKNLARVLAELGVLTAIVDENPMQRSVMKALYPSVDIFSDPEAVFADPAITAVFIATPAFLHASLGLRALASGKDVFLEKPMALSLADADALILAAEKGGRVLMVGHLLQYHPAIRALKNLVSNGTLGTVRYIQSHRLNLGVIRSHESILASFAPHDVSLLLSFAGTLPQDVMCHGAGYREGNAIDMTMSHFRFADGLRAHIYVNWLFPKKEQRLILTGDRGMAVFEDTAPDKLLWYPCSVSEEGGIPVIQSGQPEAVFIAADEPLHTECLHFLECCNKRLNPLTNAQEGRAVLQVLAACQESLDTGALVTLHTDPVPAYV